MKSRSIFLIAFVVGVLGLHSSTAAQANAAQSNCPTLVFSSSEVSAFGGEKLEVEAALLGPTTDNLSFHWTLPRGTIEAGQGTSRVRIALPKTSKRERIDLSLSINGPSVHPSCQISGKLSIFVKTPVEGEHGISRLADLVLNKSRVPCSQATHSSIDVSRRSVNVIAIPRDVGNDLLSYNFRVSGGTITQKGNVVNWDLTGVTAGTYAISASIDDGIGFGPLLSRFVTFEKCT